MDGKTYPTDDTVSDIHDLRKQIQGVIDLAYVLRQMSKPEENPNQHTNFAREISLVITKLEEAKMWSGKCLERLGSKLPAEYQDNA